LDSRTSLSPSQTDRNVHRISENLSNLVIYCQAVSWSEELFNKITQNENQTTQRDIPQPRDIQQMSSIGELKIKKYTRKGFRKFKFIQEIRFFCAIFMKSEKVKNTQLDF